MLLKINMCRLGSERREHERTRTRNLAVAVAVLGMNAVVVGLFLQALLATDAAAGEGVTLAEQQVDILRARQEQIDWGRALMRIGAMAPDEVWFARMIMTEGAPAGGGDPVPGLRLYGTLTAGRREEGVDKLMGFVQSIRNEPGFREDFQEAVLVGMNWTNEAGEDGIEFEVFCPLARADAGKI